MVRHIVMWTLKSEEKKNIETIEANLGGRFRALVGTVDGLKSVEFGRNYNGGKLDLILNCVFDSRSAEEGYQNHPAHVVVKKIVHTLVCERECVDYEF